MPDRADLEDHHADGVSDDVVQLACDARALFGDRNPSRRLPLALGVDRPFLGRGRLDVPLSEREAAEPAECEHRRDEE